MSHKRPLPDASADDAAASSDPSAKSAKAASDWCPSRLVLDYMPIPVAYAHHASPYFYLSIGMWPKQPPCVPEKEAAGILGRLPMDLIVELLTKHLADGWTRTKFAYACRYLRYVMLNTIGQHLHVFSDLLRCYAPKLVVRDTGWGWVFERARRFDIPCIVIAYLARKSARVDEDGRYQRGLCASDAAGMLEVIYREGWIALFWRALSILHDSRMPPEAFGDTLSLLLGNALFNYGRSDKYHHKCLATELLDSRFRTSIDLPEILFRTINADAAIDTGAFKLLHDTHGVCITRARAQQLLTSCVSYDKDMVAFLERCRDARPIHHSIA